MRAFGLLRRRDFRNLYLAVSVSEIGDALSYIALMWFALQKAGPSGSSPSGWLAACRASSSDSMAASLPLAVAGVIGSGAGESLSYALLVSPIFAIAAARPVFGVAAVAVPLGGLAVVMVAARTPTLRGA
ncbi:MAG: hypothetical protein WCH31_03235 [Actinomycetes bacterium]